MVTAKVDWFDKKKGIGEATDELGRKLFLSSPEIIATPKPTFLKAKDLITCSVRKGKSGYVALKICKKLRNIGRAASRDLTI